MRGTCPGLAGGRASSARGAAAAHAPPKPRTGGAARRPAPVREHAACSGCGAARRRGQRVAARASLGDSDGRTNQGLFPAGRKQIKVELPSLALRVDAGRALSDPAYCDAVSDAVRGGANLVLLFDASGSAGGGRSLYQAAVKVKDLVRGRAPLLLLDRPDLASAAGADGVLLTKDAVPLVVAREMIQDVSMLIGAEVDLAVSAGQAAADGAGVIVLRGQTSGGAAPTGEEIAAARKAQRAASIPLLAWAGDDPAAVREAASVGADGLVVDAATLPGLAEAATGSLDDDSEHAAAARALLRLMEAGGADPGVSEEEEGGVAEAAEEGRSRVEAVEAQVIGAPERTAPAWFRPGQVGVMTDAVETLLKRERDALADALRLVREASPTMEEASLLEDALAQLEELFLMVVVGEFNSGKSSVINALLGGKFLPEGILPTTNEINILKYSADAPPGQGTARQEEDGLYVRELPAPFLQEVTVVDTPGTNVVLSRQQRLTEEYVPRADLVLFVMSVDRPLTDSEVTFLKYIKRWGKKVVFVLNKADLLSSPDDVAQVEAFVRENAARILETGDPKVMSVSARQALKAKTEVGNGTDLLGTMDAEELRTSPDWIASGYNGLEQFLLGFLGGGTGAGEVLRLKMMTPVGIAEALLSAAGRQLAQEEQAARADVEALKKVAPQLDGFADAVMRDSAAQRARCREALLRAAERIDDAVDAVIQLSNPGVASAYLLGSNDRKSLPIARALSQKEIAGGLEEVEALAVQHSRWLSDNCNKQVAGYTRYCLGLAEPLGTDLTALVPDAGLATDAAWKDAAQVVQGYDAGTALSQVEEGTREAVVGTASLVGGSAVLVFLLTNILQTSIEDILALALGGAGVGVAFVTLPVKRAMVKRAARAEVERVATQLDTVMTAEAERKVAMVKDAVGAMVEPLQAAAEREEARVKALQERCEQADAAVAALRKEITATG
ncbi:unnamed protein product [Pedinophyceae sp. YPF-701]|nr:unnamed protein product [Pedinophyceae sp. YPF-701]